MLLQQTAHGAIQFAVYEEFKHVAARFAQTDSQSDRQLTSLEVSAYGALSKLVAAVSTYPTQASQQQQQQQHGGESNPSVFHESNISSPVSSTECACRLWHTDGHYMLLWCSWVLFTVLRSLLQVVRSRLQQRFDTGRTLVYGSTWETVQLTWTREGLAGFYKGLFPSLLRVIPQSAITLVVYERLLHILNDYADQGAREAALKSKALTDDMRPLVIAQDSHAEQ